MAHANDCLFCKIIAGDIPSTQVYEDDQVYAFNDINPQAKVHVLVVPKHHYENVVQLADNDSELLAHVVDVAHMIAQQSYNGDFRLVFNTGAHATQTVFHVHAHVMTGEQLQ